MSMQRKYLSGSQKRKLTEEKERRNEVSLRTQPKLLSWLKPSNGVSATSSEAPVEDQEMDYDNIENRISNTEAEGMKDFF